MNGKQFDNLYAVVREDVTEELYDDGGRRIITTGYDIKGRKVMTKTEVFGPDGSYGIMCCAVEANGYWRGGVSEYDANGQYIGGCLCASNKFDESKENNGLS